MSYTEYLRRKEAAAPKVIDTTLRLDASSYTQRVKKMHQGVELYL